MKKILILLIMLTLTGCAHTQTSVAKKDTKRVQDKRAYIVVKNTLDTSIHVHLKRPKHRLVYLGRIFPKEAKKFYIEGPYNYSKMTIISSPITGGKLQTIVQAPTAKNPIVACNVRKSYGYLAE